VASLLERGDMGLGDERKIWLKDWSQRDPWASRHNAVTSLDPECVTVIHVLSGCSNGLLGPGLCGNRQWSEETQGEIMDTAPSMAKIVSMSVRFVTITKFLIQTTW
jgi:hypothetical protein